jgi:hypothetical protein
LGKSIDLIVVATGKSEELGDELFLPRRMPWETNRTSVEQIDLGNQASTFVRFGLRGHDIDGSLAQALYETEGRCQSKILNTWRGHRTAQIDPEKCRTINGRKIRF